VTVHASTFTTQGEALARNTTVGYSPTSPVRSRWILGGIAVVLSIAVLGGAFLLGRVTAPPAHAATVGVAGMPMRDGIPVPNRHSVAGAATAAHTFQIAGFRVSTGTLDPAAAAAVLLAPDADDSARQVLAAPTGDPAQLARTRTTFAALSTVVDSYAPQRAVIHVWGVAATSSQATPQPGATETWGRSTITVVWDGTQWRVLEQQYSRGPWPVRSDQRLTDSDGSLDFRFTELPQHGWSYVPEP
jgi:hypothetical protein